MEKLDDSWDAPEPPKPGAIFLSLIYQSGAIKKIFIPFLETRPFNSAVPPPSPDDWSRSSSASTYSSGYSSSASSYRPNSSSQGPSQSRPTSSWSSDGRSNNFDPRNNAPGPSYSNPPRPPVDRGSRKTLCKKKNFPSKLIFFLPIFVFKIVGGWGSNQARSHHPYRYTQNDFPSL